MKKLLLLILISSLLTINTQAQYRQRKNISEPIKVVAIYTGSIVLNAIGDGLNDSGSKMWGHSLNALSTGLLLTSPFIVDYDKSKWGYYLTSYVFLRIALFDLVYNKTRGLPVTYIGNTSPWDKFMQILSPPDGFMFGRGVYFLIGVTIPFKTGK